MDETFAYSSRKQLHSKRLRVLKGSTGQKASEKIF